MYALKHSNGRCEMRNIQMGDVKCETRYNHRANVSIQMYAHLTRVLQGFFAYSGMILHNLFILIRSYCIDRSIDTKLGIPTVSTESSWCWGMCKQAK